MIKSILKGMVIGIANIIPGVSGGTMMVAMGIYDKLIHCITHLFKEFKESLRFLFPIIVGMGIAIVLSALGLEYLFDNVPLQTNLLFIGLIIGGFPAIWKNVKGNKVKAGHIIAFLVFFVLVTGMALLGNAEGKEADLSFSLGNILILLLIGVIASATMVIPGVSGSMVLLLLGYYKPVISAISDFIHAALEFDMPGILNGICILAPFGVGVVVGIFAIAKLMEIIFEKCPLYAFWAIIGLIAASPIAIIAAGIGEGDLTMAVLNPVNIITALIAAVIGFFVAMKLGE